MAVRDLFKSFFSPDLAKPSTAKPVEEGKVFDMLRMGNPRALSSTDILNSYETSPWVYAALNKIAETSASAEWLVYRKGDPYKKPVEGMPIMEALHKGNFFMTGYEMQVLSYITLELVGEAYWMLLPSQKRNNKFQQQYISQVLPVPPEWVLRRPKSIDEPYVFRVPSGGAWEVPAQFVIPLQRPHPRDPYNSVVSGGRALANEIAADQQAASFVNAFFTNMAIPTTIIAAEGLGPDETKEFEKRWLEEFKGVHRSNKPKFVNRDVTIHQLQGNMEALQMPAMRERSRDAILQTFGVPPEIVGVLENSNRATIQQAEQFFHKYTIAPRLERMRSVLQKLIDARTPGRFQVEFDLSSALEVETKASIMRAHPHAFTLDEVRSLAGHNPLPEGQGQIHAVPGHFNLMDGVEELVGGELEPRESEEDEERMTEEERQERESRLQEVESEEETRERQEREEDSRQEPVRKERGRKKEVRAFAKASAEAFRETVETGMDRGLQEEEGESALEEIMLSIMVAYYLLERQSIRQKLEELGDEAGLVEYPEIETEEQMATSTKLLLAGAAANLALGDWKSINNTSTDSILQSASQYMRDGAAGRDAVRRAATDVMLGDNADYRARRAGETGAIGAANKGILQAADESPLQGKQWLTQLDDRVRPSHRTLHGVIVGKNEYFELGGDKAKQPKGFSSASENANCRCFLQTVPLNNPEKSMGPRDQVTLEKQLADATIEDAYRVREKKITAGENAIIDLVASVFRRQRQAILRLQK